MALIEGKTIFNSHLTKHELYQGKSTEKYALQLSLTKEQAKTLKALGMVIKEYEGQPLRKFTSRYDVPLFDRAGEELHREVPPGSTVRIEYITKPHKTAGEIPYMKRVLLMEVGEENQEDMEFFSGS
jgi:hypothetical protein